MSTRAKAFLSMGAEDYAARCAFCKIIAAISGEVGVLAFLAIGYLMWAYFEPWSWGFLGSENEGKMLGMLLVYCLAFAGFLMGCVMGGWIIRKINVWGDGSVGPAGRQP